MGSSTTQIIVLSVKMRCDNPSKWGLQQRRSVFDLCFCSCDNPSKWGLQQQILINIVYVESCDNPSKWGLQQHANQGIKKS